jgi:hypothetical protein
VLCDAPVLAAVALGAPPGLVDLLVGGSSSRRQQQEQAVGTDSGSSSSSRKPVANLAETTVV